MGAPLCVPSLVCVYYYFRKRIFLQRWFVKGEGLEDTPSFVLELYSYFKMEIEEIQYDSNSRPLELSFRNHLHPYVYLVYVLQL